MNQKPGNKRRILYLAPRTSRLVPCDRSSGREVCGGAQIDTKAARR